MSRRVLIVEDEIIVADDLEWQLGKIGYEVTAVAASGEEAVTAAVRDQPDIVLMDFQLQGRMNGIEAATVIQSRTGAAVIFITAFPAMYLAGSEQMRPPGICVSKPFSTVQLRAALESVGAASNQQ